MSSTRPASMREVIGQEDACRQVETMITAARRLHRLPKHVLLLGPAGCGKTSLARLIGWRLDAPFHENTAGAVNDLETMADQLAALESGAVLFIDEFDGVSKKVRRQVLYKAMEDGVGYVKRKGTGVQTIKVEPFVLVAATTESKIEPAMERRFRRIELEYYSASDLAKIVEWNAERELLGIEADAALYLAERSQGVPATAQNLLELTIEHIAANAEMMPEVISMDHVVQAMDSNRIDAFGLSRTLRGILTVIAEESLGRAIGLKAIASAKGARSVEEEVAVLWRLGLVKGTDNGKFATEAAYRLLWPNEPVPVLARGR